MRTSPEERESMLREENRRLREQLEALREAVLQDEADGTFPHRTSQVLNPAKEPS